jgi:hypothetical protein
VERNIAVPRAIWPGIESTHRRNSEGLDRISFKNMQSQKSRGFIPLCRRRRVYWMTIVVCRSFDWLRSLTEHPIAPQRWKRHAASKNLDCRVRWLAPRCRGAPRMAIHYFGVTIRKSNNKHWWRRLRHRVVSSPRASRAMMNMRRRTSSIQRMTCRKTGSGLTNDHRCASNEGFSADSKRQANCTTRHYKGSHYIRSQKNNGSRSYLTGHGFRRQFLNFH